MAKFRLQELVGYSDDARCDPSERKSSGLQRSALVHREVANIFLLVSDVLIKFFPSLGSARANGVCTRGGCRMVALRIKRISMQHKCPPMSAGARQTRRLESCKLHEYARSAQGAVSGRTSTFELCHADSNTGSRRAKVRRQRMDSLD